MARTIVSSDPDRVDGLEIDRLELVWPGMARGGRRFGLPRLCCCAEFDQGNRWASAARAVLALTGLPALFGEFSFAAFTIMLGSVAPLRGASPKKRLMGSAPDPRFRTLGICHS